MVLVGRLLAVVLLAAALYPPAPVAADEAAVAAGAATALTLEALPAIRGVGGESVVVRASLHGPHGEPVSDDDPAGTEPPVMVAWQVSSGAETLRSYVSPELSPVGLPTSGEYGWCIPAPQRGQACTVLTIPPSPSQPQTLTITARATTSQGELVASATIRVGPAPPVVAPLSAGAPGPGA